MKEPLSQSLEVDASAHQQAEQPGILTPDAQMLVLTWVTFFLLLIVLYKYAWKPILTALEAREENIRKSLEDARKAREELARVTETSRKIVVAADEQAKMIVERSRKAAQEAAQVIERKARDETSILLTNATSEIEALQKKVQTDLKKEGVDLAIHLAGKLIHEHLDKSKHEKLVDRLIKDFEPEAYGKS